MTAGGRFAEPLQCCQHIVWSRSRYQRCSFSRQRQQQARVCAWLLIQRLLLAQLGCTAAAEAAAPAGSIGSNRGHASLRRLHAAPTAKRCAWALVEIYGALCLCWDSTVFW